VLIIGFGSVWLAGFFIYIFPWILPGFLLHNPTIQGVPLIGGRMCCIALGLVYFAPKLHMSDIVHTSMGDKLRSLAILL